MQQRTFPASARPGDRQKLVLRNLQRNIVQRGSGVWITAGDVAQTNHFAKLRNVFMVS